MSSVLDKIFLTLLTLLLIGTPFAIGSTPPICYSIMEVGIFALVVVWMLKLMVVRREASGVRRGGNGLVSQPSSLLASQQWRGAIPLALLIGLVGFQLTPIPPSVMRLISPHTYEFYQHIFCNWPNQAPYADLDVAKFEAEK